MAGKFVVKKGTTGKFRFSLLSANGQIVASSEAYNSKAACMNGIKSVKSNAAGAEIEDQTTRQWAADEQDRKSATATRKAAAKKSSAKKSSAAKAPAKRGARKSAG